MIKLPPQNVEYTSKQATGTVNEFLGRQSKKKKTTRHYIRTEMSRTVHAGADSNPSIREPVKKLGRDTVVRCRCFTRLAASRATCSREVAQVDCCGTGKTEMNVS